MKATITLACFACLALLNLNSPAQAQDGANESPVADQFMQIDLVLDRPDLSQTRLSGPVAPRTELTSLASIVRDDFDYNGLSFYLGEALPVSMDEQNKVQKIDIESESCVPVSERWVGFRGRFETVLIRTDDAQICLTEGGATLTWSEPLMADQTSQSVTLIRGSHDMIKRPPDAFPDIRKLQYAHLPDPLAWLCEAIEWIYRMIVAIPLIGWASGLFLFALVMKILLLPIISLTARWQEEVAEHKAALLPLHKEIKATLKGEAAHKALMKTYRDRKITPYYSLKPLIATFIGLPVLIAIFNMLGAIAALNSVPFLWADSLAYPDRLLRLPFSVPGLGEYLNVFPVMMTLATLFAAWWGYRTALASGPAVKPWGLYGMAVAFLVIFYTFPSGMVLYWTLSTLIGVAFSALKRG